MILGIDPGRSSGGVCFLEKDGTVTALEVMPPLLYSLVEMIHEYNPRMVFLEKAQSFPGQGISSAFNYGDHFGQLQGVLIALQKPYTLVGPARWTKELHIGCTGEDAKAKSLQAVTRIFPTVDLIATERSRKPHEGLIDALLIAEYGRRSCA